MAHAANRKTILVPRSAEVGVRLVSVASGSDPSWAGSLGFPSIDDSRRVSVFAPSAPAPTSREAYRMPDWSFCLGGDLRNRTLHHS